MPIYSANTGFSIKGIDLGSNNFRALKKPKAAKDVKGFDEQFETVKAKYPKSVVTKRKGKLGSYTVRTDTGSFGYTPGKPVD